MRFRSNALPMAAALLALCYLSTMVIVGSLPEQRQLVKFEARGVMQTPPELISRVELVQAGRKVLLDRDPKATRWARANGTILSTNAAAHLTMAVQMMNTSGPVKEISDEDLRGLDRGPFGLDRPIVQAALYQGDAAVIRMRFGNLNPEGYLQYMSVDGSPRVFLMSRFVGEEWKKAAEAVFGH